MIPDRTKTNIRFYSDDQLKKLLNIGILQKNGYQISAINEMSDDEIFESVFQIISSHDSRYEDQIRALVLSMIEMDEDAFTRIFDNQVFRIGFLSTMTELIYPFLITVGGLWTNNKSFPAQEHFVSNLIRQKIISGIDSIPSPPGKAPRIILFLAKGEHHEIGLLLSNYIAKDMGFRVYYIGQNVPQQDVPVVVDLVKADLLFTIFQITKQKLMEDILESISSKITVPLLVSGNQLLLDHISVKEGIVRMSGPGEFVDYLKTFKKLR
jgi:methanogenic corrinoid protein MtbC1